MPILFNIAATLAIGIVLIPAVFKGKMKSNIEILWLIAATLSMAFSLMFLVKPGYFTACSVIATLCLTFSKQGRHLYIETLFLPLELTNRIYHSAKNIFLEKQTYYNYKWFNKNKNLFRTKLEACSNWDIEKEKPVSASW